MTLPIQLNGAPVVLHASLPRGYDIKGIQLQLMHMLVFYPRYSAIRRLDMACLFPAAPKVPN